MPDAYEYAVCNTNEKKNYPINEANTKGEESQIIVITKAEYDKIFNFK